MIFDTSFEPCMISSIALKHTKHKIYKTEQLKKALNSESTGVYSRQESDLETVENLPSIGSHKLNIDNLQQSQELKSKKQFSTK